MRQPLGSSSSTPPSSNDETRENELLAEMEGLLERSQAPGPFVHAASGSTSLRRVVPFVLLAGIGAILAMMPASLKDELMTGRSVAHGSPDR